jgi:hypothetical protein
MNTRTSPKTPYEIRLDLLQLAFDLLVKKHEAEAAKGHHAVGDKLAPVSAPTAEEVIAEAEKMNQFVSKANQAH